MTESTIKALQEYYIEHNEEFAKLTAMDAGTKKEEINSVLSKLGINTNESEITEIISTLPSILEETELPDHLIQAASGGGKLKDLVQGSSSSQGNATVTVGGDSTNTNINTTKDGEVNIGGTQKNTNINRQ